jgi:adenosylmethionine-8-amino-7-oxononanoate aminotransferase
VTLEERDLKHIWHPCSQMKDYEELAPIVIEKGKGVYLYDYKGNRYLDAISSWWVNIFGHSNDKINEVIKKQIDDLEHVIFVNFTHKPAIELSEKIIEIVPKGLNKIFFADNGSSAIEVALKMSFQYHQQKNKKKKTKFLAVKNGYHGETIGALSVGGVDLYNQIYKPILIDTIISDGPDCFKCPYNKNRETCNAECFESIEKTVKDNHEEISAVVIEPMVQAAAGMKIYSKEYLKKLRKLCTDFDIHFIADEIAVGFGRTGKMFACEHPEITPDIMCVSKGLTAGYLPLALTITTDEIYNAFYDDYVTLKAFLHSHSYTGNPITSSIALKTIEIFQNENVILENEKKSKYLKKRVLELFGDHPNFGEYRQLGMIGAIELVKNRNNKDEFDWKDRIGYNIYKIGLNNGLIIRPLGNIIYFMPPYVIKNEEIDFMLNNTLKSVNEYFKL